MAQSALPETLGAIHVHGTLPLQYAVLDKMRIHSRSSSDHTQKHSPLQKSSRACVVVTCSHAVCSAEQSVAAMYGRGHGHSLAQLLVICNQMKNPVPEGTPLKSHPPRHAKDAVVVVVVLQSHVVVDVVVVVDVQATVGVCVPRTHVVYVHSPFAMPQ